MDLRCCFAAKKCPELVCSEELFKGLYFNLIFTRCVRKAICNLCFFLLYSYMACLHNSEKPVLNPLTRRKFAENSNLKPLMLFCDCCGGKLLAYCPKRCLQSVLDQINRLLGSGMRTIKAKLFLFCRFLSFLLSFLLHFSLVAGRSLDFIYDVKVFQKTLKM